MSWAEYIGWEPEPSEDLMVAAVKAFRKKDFATSRSLLGELNYRERTVGLNHRVRRVHMRLLAATERSLRHEGYQRTHHR